MDREDYAYGQWKQKQIDEGLWKKKQLPIVGSALPDSEKIAKFANYDPNPHVPFVDPSFPKMSKWEKLAWSITVGIWLGYVVGFFGGAW